MNHRNFGQSDSRYIVNANHPETVVAFDTDYTIGYADGPVPLSHVISLREADDVAVYATGFNQTLRDEAEIPGMAEIKEMCDMDLTDWVPRADRMRLLAKIHRDADEYIVVDDTDLRQLHDEGWRYYHPIEYVVEELDVPVEESMAAGRLTVREYLMAAGRYMTQFPPDELSLDSDEPYTARTRNGVRTPAHRRGADGSPFDDDGSLGSVTRVAETDEKELADRVSEAFGEGDGK